MTLKILYTIHGVVFTKGGYKHALSMGFNISKLCTFCFVNSILRFLLNPCFLVYSVICVCACTYKDVCIHMYVSVNKMKGGDCSLLQSVSNGKNQTSLNTAFRQFLTGFIS